MIKIPPAILSDGLAKLELNQLINMENLLAHIVNRHGQNFLSVTAGGPAIDQSGKIKSTRELSLVPKCLTRGLVTKYRLAHNEYYVK